MWVFSLYSLQFYLMFGLLVLYQCVFRLMLSLKSVLFHRLLVSRYISQVIFALHCESAKHCHLDVTSCTCVVKYCVGLVLFDKLSLLTLSSFTCFTSFSWRVLLLLSVRKQRRNEGMKGEEGKGRGEGKQSYYCGVGREGGSGK